MKVLYFIVFVAAAYAGPVPQDVEEAQMEAEPQTPNVFPHFREQENPLKALETLRDDPMPKSNDPIKIVQKSESQKDAKTNLLVRKKRWSFDDLIEVLLRMKYGLFFHQNVTEITDNSIDDQPSSVTSRAEVTTSVPTYSDVADQFGAENLVSEFGEYRMRPEKGVEYDLESDTRVNYVRGYHRNELDNNDEVEVFDWDLVSEDAEKNSGNPYGRAEELKESAKISDDTKNGFLVSEGIRRISEVPNQRSSSLRMVRPAPYVNPVVGSIPSIPPPIAGEDAVFYFKSNSGPAPYAYQSGLPTSYNNDDVEIL